MLDALPMSNPNLARLDDVAHIIQLALTPVFLLTGIGTLMNVFATRLARVADQVDRIADAIEDARGGEGRDVRRRLDLLRVRSVALDIAVILGAIGGASTGGAVLLLFVGALRDAGVATALFLLFGAAILCTIAALVAFLYEMLLASSFIRARVDRSGSETES